jgi:hypothetical protein
LRLVNVGKLAGMHLPSELVALVFGFVAHEDDARAKTLRLVNRENSRRFARQVWLVGARAFYLNYIRRLPLHQRRTTLRLLLGSKWGGAFGDPRLAARAAAQATSEAILDDACLFAQLSKCGKFLKTIS